MLVEGNVARIVRRRGYERVGLSPAPLTDVPISRYPALVRMMETGSPVVIPDTTAAVDWVVGRPGRDWRLSYVAAPILVKGQTVGFLNVNGAQAGQFGPADARRLQIFADHAAAAIENARLYQEQHEYAEQLEGRVRERTAQLQAQYAWLEAVLGSTTNGIIVVDTAGEIILSNPVAQTWLNQMLSPQDAARLRDAVRDIARQAQASDRNPTTLLELKGLDLELRAAQISDRSREEAVAVVAAHDVSHLRALDRMKTRFVSNVSHELRTPVTTIKLYAALMARTPPEKWKTYLEALTQEADRQASLVEDILQISRIDAGRLALETRSIALNELIEAAVISHQVLAGNKQLTLTQQPLEVSPIVCVDPERMMQVLNNLVENGIHYTPEGGTIVVSAGTEEMAGRTWAVVKVSDTGWGIPAEEQPHLFERFFRGEEPRQMQVPGTGLGLAIVREIVELHGGQVTVESQVGAGTTFVVWLPLAG
jgi:signal transduction histidine kinase